MNLKILFAIFQRNLVSYFTNPLGYIFVCVFVILSSLAAFAPPEFFNNNLATLDQLNQWFPAIMLLFVPAITMSLWAEERKQSTDELLLTLPATDLDIVLGKYLSALAIFALSLVFSFVSNLIVLESLGDPDFGLFFTNYVGYFFVGVAMLSIGMVASFLTKNLTVAFILGAAFNAPLVALQKADIVIPRADWALNFKTWGIQENFNDFGRGVVSISSVAYFVLIAVVMVYLSIVLLGRRHWLGGKDGSSLLGHYLGRTFALLIIAVSTMYFFRHHNFIRVDFTVDEMNSLADETEKLLDDTYASLKKQDTKIEIEAFISPDVPEDYVQQREELLTLLREIDSEAGSSIDVRIYDTKPASEIARRAEAEYDITGRRVAGRSRGIVETKTIYLGAVFRAGLRRVVVPFFSPGVPVESELIRAICVVTDTRRKKLGVVRTDARMMGGFGMGPKLIIDELRKQYEVIDVDPAKPIVNPEDPKQTEYDVLLVVQPSTLPQEGMTNLMDAIQAGVPAAIFEDPFPIPSFWEPPVGGTDEPRTPPHPRMPVQPKGRVDDLWNMLGVRQLSALSVPQIRDDRKAIAWREYNPYPRLRREGLYKELVFVHVDAPGGDRSFSPDPITGGLKDLLFAFPGGFSSREDSKLDFVKLITIHGKTGIVTPLRLRSDPSRLRFAEFPTGESYTLAARVTGEIDIPESASQGKRKLKSGKGKVNVVLVADIDIISSQSLRWRAEPDSERKFHFQNVNFVLNVIDSLAGDNRFPEIRKREKPYRTLSHVEAKLNAIWERTSDEINKSTEEFKAAKEKTEEETRAILANTVEEALKRLLASVKKRRKSGDPPSKLEETIAEDLRTLQQVRKNLGTSALDYERILRSIRLGSDLAGVAEKEVEDVEESYEKQKSYREEQEKQRTEALERDLEQKIEKLQKDLEQKEREIQDSYKLAAVVLPPIPPLVLALVVLYRRKRQEKEGVAEMRLR